MKHRSPLTTLGVTAVAFGVALWLALAPAGALQQRERSRAPVRRPPASDGSEPIRQDENTAAAVSRGALRTGVPATARLERNGELRLRTVQVDTVLEGRRHERLEQYYKGVPVLGGDVSREMKGQVAVGVFGRVHANIAIGTTPRLSEDAAVQIVERLLGRRPGPTFPPELVILPRDDGTYVLTYCIRVFTGTALPIVFVNAVNGSIELQYNNLQTQATIGRGTGVLGDEKKFSGLLQDSLYLASDRMRPSSIVTFDMHGDLQRTISVEEGVRPLLTSDIATDADNTWTDGDVVDAHTYLGWTYDYFFKRFGRHGLDDRDGRRILTLVHPVRRQDIQQNLPDYVGYYTDAWFCGFCSQSGEDTMMFGEGIPPGWFVVSSGQYVDYIAAALDIVAHEYTHGVTQYSSNLIYRNESGALSEAFSDMMATGAEFFQQPAGSGILKADYLVGEDAWRAYRSGSISGIRSLSDPSVFGDPDHYSHRYVGSDDNGGVHTNCTIAGHAFYLAIEGGTNRTSGLAVQGVGASNREQIEKVFYRAFVYYLPSDATFSLARAATIRSAQELYGAGSAVDRAITQAWTAVGVD
jgi:bacillolysin